MKKCTFLFILAIVCLFVFSNTQAQDNKNYSAPSFGFAPAYNPDLDPNHNFVTDHSPTSIARGINNTGATTAIFGKWALGTPSGFASVNPTFNGASFAGGLGPDGFYYCIDNGPPVNLYRVDTATGVKTLVAPVTGLFGTEGWTELAYDASTSTWYASSGSATSSSLYTMNMTTGVATRIGASGTGLIITIAIHPTTYVMYGIDIVADALVTINKATGAPTTVGPIGFNSNYGAGSCFDELGVMYFASIDAGAGNARNFYTMNLTTGTATLVGSFPATAQVSSLGVPMPPPPPPSGDSTLVMFHDTTVTGGLAKRMADRDSVMKYLPGMISKYRVVYFNQTSTIPSLANYKTIVLVETSFDNSGALVLSPSARTDIKAWLTSGTPTDRKCLIQVGGDQGYNYDRTGGSGLDTAFSRGFCGFIYRVDSGMPSPGTITGVLADIGNTRTIVSPSDAGYYPDGCSPTNGGLTLYKYGNHSALDTLAGISRLTAGYLTVSSFQDPRYFTGGNLKPWMAALIAYAKTNGATITNATPLTSIVADKYSLSQNYPNPFNPTTKISFTIPANGFVSLKVYNITGQEVMTLVNENMHTGAYSVDFNGAFLSSGVYFYRLESANFVETKKMMLVK